MIAVLFARGDTDATDAALRHRLNQCCHGTECGRLCTWLIKAPGVALVHCTHPDHPEPLLLYPALEDPEFACPLGRF